MKFKKLTIGNICDFIGGSQPPKSEFSSNSLDGYIRLIQTRDYRTSEYLTYIPEKYAKKKCDVDDIMIGRYGPPIFQIFRGLKGAYNVALMKAVPKEGVDKEFLYYVLKQNAIFEYVDKLSPRTGGQTGVDLVSLNRYPVFLPENIVDQQKIIKPLVLIDKKIEINKSINLEIENFINLIYPYWFLQFNFPNLEGKPYVLSGGSLVFNSLVKKDIPQNWEVVQIKDILDKAPAVDKISAKDYLDKGTIPVIDQSQSFIAGFTNNHNAKILPHDAHIIFGDHTRAVKLANFAYARGADGTQVLASKNNRVPNYLLYNIVKNIDLSNFGYARHYKFLKETQCIIPDEVTAQKFNQLVSPLYEKIKSNILFNIELERIRDSLLPMLVNGQISIRSAEELIAKTFEQNE